MCEGSDISAYEGLVGKTALMFADMLGMELEDLRQELRLKILKARRAFDPTRSKMSERAYVYSCVANLIKDFKRDRARRSGRLHIAYIEGFGHLNRNGAGRAWDQMAGRDWFEFHFASADHDTIFGAIDDGGFVMPATVTEREQEVILLLVLGYAQTEIAQSLGIEYAEVVKLMRGLREKLADWRPNKPESVPLARTAQAADEAVRRPRERAAA